MRPRRTKRGFSMIEVMIAAAILGIGVMAAVRLFSTGVDGVTWTRSRSAATNIAVQRLEFLGTQGLDQLPACAGVVGCKEGPNTLAAPLGNAGTYACTQRVSDMSSQPSVSDPNGRFRVDTVVEPHPDAGRQPGALVVTVSVCWTEDNLVHQAQLNRLFIPSIDN